MTCAVASQPGAVAGLTLESAKCAICGQDNGEPHAVGEDFEYQTTPDTFLMMRCERCGLLYLNPRPTAESLPTIYPDHYHAFDFSQGDFGLVHWVRRRLEARRLLRWCRHLPNDARILDVGCGDGFHLALLRDFGKPGWQVQGVDLDERAVHNAASRGLSVLHGQVEAMPMDEGYDLTLMIMTIEHLSQPLQTLRQVVQRMKPGGRLVVVTDNVCSPDQSMFGGRYWGGYHFPRHTYLFSPRTLRLLAEHAGLEVESVRSAVSPVNWTYSIRNLLVDWDAPRWLINRFSLRSPVGLAVFTLLDLPLNLIGRGAILHGVFKKPGTQPL